MKDMKRCYLDANLLFYWQDPKSPFNQAATNIVERLVQGGYFLFVSSLVLDEYLYTCLRFSGKSKIEMKDNLKFSLKRVLKIPTLRLINPSLDERKHLKVIDLIAKFNLHPRDAYHLFIMLENKVKFLATFDSDFEKVFKKGLIKQFI